MAASPVDSVGAETQHGEAEPRAVLASFGVAGVHGTVQRPEAGKMAAAEEIGLGLGRAAGARSRGGVRRSCTAAGGPPLDHHGGARQGGARGRHGGMVAAVSPLSPQGRCRFYR